MLTLLCAVALFFSGCDRGIIDDLAARSQAEIEAASVAAQSPSNDEAPEVDDDDANLAERLPDEEGLEIRPDEEWLDENREREETRANTEGPEDLDGLADEVRENDGDNDAPREETEGDDELEGEAVLDGEYEEEWFDGEVEDEDAREVTSEGEDRPDGEVEDEERTRGEFDDENDFGEQEGIEEREGGFGEEEESQGGEGIGGDLEENRDDDAARRRALGIGATYGDSSATLRIQAIGDSHLAFNGSQSIPAQLSRILTASGQANFIQNNAIGGATLGCGQNGIGNSEHCIPPQFVSGNWTHIMLSAGVNDYLEESGDCSMNLDNLISADLSSGLMVDFVRRLRSTGAEVVIVGYVELLDPNGWASCAPLDSMMQRYRDFAARTSGVRFVDTRNAFTRNQSSNYADDIHTSVEGSRRLAEHIVQQLSF